MAFELLSSLVAHIGLAPMGKEGMSVPSMAMSWLACLAHIMALASPVDELYSPGIQLVKIIRGICHLIRCIPWNRMTYGMSKQPGTPNGQPWPYERHTDH